MSAQVKDQLMKIQKEFVGDVLTLAELGLSREQFRQFKKKVFEAYHDKLKPKTSELLKDDHERRCRMK
jgi:hypothetical protein